MFTDEDREYLILAVSEKLIYLRGNLQILKPGTKMFDYVSKRISMFEAVLDKLKG